MLLKNASAEIDVSLVFTTVLFGDRGAESHTAVHVARQQQKNHAGYSQVPEVDVVPQTVVVDFKQSVLIGYVSARTNNNNGDNNSQTDQKMKLPANTGCSED